MILTLLNEALVGKECRNEDSNTKFLIALPELWDFKKTTIKDNNDLNKVSLDEVYAMLKTYDLEM